MDMDSKHTLSQTGIFLNIILLIKLQAEYGLNMSTLLLLAF